MRRQMGAGMGGGSQAAAAMQAHLQGIGGHMPQLHQPLQQQHHQAPHQHTPGHPQPDGMWSSHPPYLGGGGGSGGGTVAASGQPQGHHHLEAQGGGAAAAAAAAADQSGGGGGGGGKADGLSSACYSSRGKTPPLQGRGISEFFGKTPPPQGRGISEFFGKTPPPPPPGRGISELFGLALSLAPTVHPSPTRASLDDSSRAPYALGGNACASP
jgi:hypothetical protein